jgi:hypothetical protein
MNENKLYRWMFVFLLATFSFLPQKIYAQEDGLNLTLSPISIQLEGKPGEIIYSQLKVRNNSNSSESLSITLGSFSADQNGSTPIIKDRTLKDDYLNWFKFQSDNFEISPGEWKTIPFSIQIPFESAFSYYAAIQVNRIEDISAVNDGKTVVKGSPAILLLLNIDSPDAKKELLLESFKAQNKIVESLPYEFEVQVKNSGNVYAIPYGNLFIEGQNQKDLAILPINPDSNVVISGSTRKYKVVWDDGFPIKGDGFLGFDWNFSEIDKFRMGRYKANIIMVYDNGEKDIASESSINFWVIPWKILSVVVLLSGFAFFGVWSSIRRIFKPIWKSKK